MGGRVTLLSAKAGVGSETVRAPIADSAIAASSSFRTLLLISVSPVLQRKPGNHYAAVRFRVFVPPSQIHSRGSPIDRIASVVIEREGSQESLRGRGSSAAF